MSFRQFILWALLLAAASCSEKEFAPSNPQKSFLIAREPFDDENYEIALSKLGEFRTRFPYSQYSTEAELLIADAQFALSQYAEATASYKEFAKLHPKHPKRDYALYRIGESYWKDAPEEVNREQYLTAKAIEEWELLLKEYPQSPYTPGARSRIEKGKRRIARSELFVAEFYCRKEIWHACAYRYIELANTAPTEFRDIIREALEKGAFALRRLAEKKVPSDSQSNLFFRKMSSKDLRAQADRMTEKTKSLR